MGWTEKGPHGSEKEGKGGGRRIRAVAWDPCHWGSARAHGVFDGREAGQRRIEAEEEERQERGEEEDNVHAGEQGSPRREPREVLLDEGPFQQALPRSGSNWDLPPPHPTTSLNLHFPRCTRDCASVISQWQEAGQTPRQMGPG